MKQNKPYYQSLNFNGFTWSGYWGKLHHFTLKDEKGYLCIACNDRDIEDGNILDMITLNVSR